MTDYTKTTDFTSKDSLPSGDSGKIIRGAEFGTEFDNIETAVNSKSNINNPAFTGNITVTGTVDGRDIAADGTKLDTIETSADVTDTANVTAAGAVMDSELTNEAAVKALNQGVATTDSPTFAAVTSTGNVTVGGTVDGRDVAADGTKLDTVETNADVTDTANVTAAGALMDSEVTNLDQVKAFDSADYATAAQGTTADNALPKTGGAMTGAITTNSTFDGRDVATDGTKLDGIEASADVTDTANVTAAGALMDSELTSEASVKALNQGVATTDSPTFAGVTANGTVEFDGLSGTGAVTVTDILDQDDMSGNSATALATQQSIKAYVDSQVGTVDTLAEVLANGNATGGTDIAFGDNDKAVFGAGSDLQIYHDGSNSYIDETATGHLFIRSNGDGIYLRSSTNEEIAHFNVNGSVKAYYDNSLKLATTSTGVDVTGTATMDGLTVDGDASVAGTIGVTADNGTITTGKDSASSRTHWSMNNPNGEVAKWDSNGTDLLHFITDEYKVYTAGNKAFEIDGNGDISFYEDTGTTPKLFWDASAESLGIGTSLPQKPLHINSGTGNIGVRVESSDATASIEFMDNGTTSTALSPRVGGISDDFFVQTNGTEAMRIDSSGQVGIGTSNIGARLTLGDASSTDSTNLIRSYRGAGTSTYAVFGDNGGGAMVEHVGGGSVFFKTNNTERMRIDSSGNVGIACTPDTALNAFGYKVLEVAGANTTKSGALLLSNSSGTNFGQIYADNSDGWKFVNGQATKSTIFYGGSGAAERMRLDASGNLLVGKTNTTFSVTGIENRADGRITSTRSGNTNLVLNRLSSDGSLIDFYKDGATVGSIGTDTSRFKVKSNSLALYLENESNKQLVWGNVSGVPYFYPQSDNDTNIGYPTQRFKDLYLSGTANAGNMQVSNGGKYIFGGENTRITGETDGSGKISLFTGGTEKVTLSGGNLLVSKTSNDNSTAGVVLRDTGEGSFVASGQRSGLFNRLSSDGEIINFRKDGTSVGSIGCNAGSFAFGQTNTGLGAFNTDRILFPATASGVVQNAQIDLGYANGRFKDLYLSGGVYLGGTGSANKLDDYEEGTWTPTLVTGGWTLDGLVRASYTKIGNTVHVRCYTGVSGTGNSAALVLGGLPFTANTNSFSTGIANLQKSLYAGTYARVEATTTTIGFYASAESTSTNLIEIQGTDIGSGYIIFSVTYETT